MLVMFVFVNIFFNIASYCFIVNNVNAYYNEKSPTKALLSCLLIYILSSDTEMVFDTLDHVADDNL